MSKGSNTTTSTQTPSALPAYQGAINQLQQVGATPYTPYSGELVAGVNPEQQTGIGTIGNYATAGVPYLQSAASMIGQAATPLTSGQIQNYQSPYTQDVINATMANFNTQNAEQQQQVLGNAAAQGALGGDRTAVAQSVLAGQQQAAQAPVIAGLENTGYNQAVQLAMQQYQQNPEQAAYGLGSTGQAIENAGLTGANAQIGAGTLEQQTQQAQDTAALQQYMQTQFMPESMLSWELPLLTGVGSQEGGTSSTTGPAPNPLAQYLGLGIAGVGAAGQAGGSAGIAGLATLFSDRRGKENIRKIGKLNDGQHVYRFNYKGDPTTHIGLIAQDVEKDNPDAVHEIQGWKHVDYDEATKDAVRRYFGGRVQGLQTGGVPSGMGFSPGIPTNPWLGQSQMARGPGAPRPPGSPNNQQVQSAQQMVANATGLASAMKKAVGNTTDNNPAFGGGNSLTGVFGGSGSAPLEGLDASDYGVGYKRGGRTTPVRAGLGMASFMPRRGFADGGSPDDDTLNFSDRFADAVPNAPSLDPGPDAGVAGQSVASTEQLPDVPQGLAQVDPMDRYQAAVKHLETGGQQNPYGSMVPSVDPKTGKTRYALGAYGIMDSNVPKWTEEALGQTMTPQEFLGNQAAQDAVFRAKFGNYTDKYGPEGAARAWLAGEGGMNNPNAKDRFGSDPLSYGRKFANAVALGTGSTGSAGPTAGPALGFAEENPNTTTGTYPGIFSALNDGSRGVGLSTAPDSVNVAPAKAVSAEDLPESVKTMRERAAGTGALGLSTDFYQSLMAAGLGMMASRSPFLGTAIGEGGLQGLGTYSGLKKQEQDVDLKVKQLNQSAKAEQDRIAQEAKQLGETSRHNQATEQYQSSFKQFEEGKPQTMFDQNSGTIRAYQRDPTGVWRWLDSGQPMVGASVPTPGTQPGGTHPSGVPTSPNNNVPTSAGQPRVMPAVFTSADGFRVQNEKAIAAGQPYNYSGGAPYIEGGMDVPEPTAVAGKSPATLKTEAEYYLQTGKLPAGVVPRSGNSPVAQAQNAYANAVKNYATSLAASRNLTPEQTADMWRSAPGMLRFVMGADGRATVSLGTAMRHLDLLQQLGTAWGAGDNQTVNRVRAMISREFGSDAATNLSTASQIIGPEIIKAIGIAGGGGEGERAAASAWANPISSPTQLAGAVKVTQGLLAGQLEGKRNQAAAAGVDEQKFKTLIGDRPYEILTNVSKGNAGAGATAAPQPPVPGAKLYQGRWYTRGPGGEAVPVTP